MNQFQIPYYTRILRSFIQYIKKNDKILDVGCGNGVWTDLLSRFCDLCIGVDIFKNSQWKVIKNWKKEFLVADGSNLPFRDNSLDIVFEKDALHHADTPVNFLAEMKRVKKRSIVIVEGNRYNPLSYLWMVKIRGHNHFSYNQLAQLVSHKLSNMEINISQVEAHYLPIPLSVGIFKTACEAIENVLQWVFERIKICNYNIVIAE